MNRFLQKRLIVGAAVSVTLLATTGGVNAAAAPSETARTAIFPVALSDDLLMVFTEPKAGQAQGLSQWYGTHLKEFTGIPGVSAAQRFNLVKQAKVSDGLLDQLAMYDIAAASAPSLDAEVKGRMKDGRMHPGNAFYEPSIFHLLYRPIGPATNAATIPGSNQQPIGAGPVSDNFLVVLSDPSSIDQEDTYNTWYDHQHIPDVLRVPGFMSAQRFVRIGGAATMPRYLVIFEFKSRDVEATNSEIGRRIREKLTVMSPAFGSAKGVIATPATAAVLAGR